MSIVILYGPPGSGKDTVSRKLSELNANFKLFRPLRSGSLSDRYRHLPTPSSVTEDECLAVSERYGRLYVFDRPELERMLDDRQSPILHVGDLAALKQLLTARPDALPVLLNCSREETERRSVGRGDTDVAARLSAWDRVADELKSDVFDEFALVFDTEMTMPSMAAHHIARLAAAD
jgi:guanylate kinase